MPARVSAVLERHRFARFCDILEEERQDHGRAASTGARE